MFKYFLYLENKHAVKEKKERLGNEKPSRAKRKKEDVNYFVIKQ